MSTGYSLVGLLENGVFLEMPNCSAPYAVRAFVVENDQDEAKIPVAYYQAFPPIKGHVVKG